MQQHMVTVSTKGQLVLPADVSAQLGIEPGTRIALTVKGSSIILEPVDKRFVASLRGMFATNPSELSLTDELIQQRREEHKRDKF